MFEGETINKQELIDLLNEAGCALECRSDIVVTKVDGEEITIPHAVISGMQNTLAAIVRTLNGTDANSRHSLALRILGLYALTREEIERIINEQEGSAE